MKKNSIKLLMLNIALAMFATNGFAQTWPCGQYITRQVPNGSGGYITNISYVYNLSTTSPAGCVTECNLDTLLNASAIYNGYIWGWKQYTGTAESGSGGQRLIKVNYNNGDSTVTPTIKGYTFSSITMNCNAAFVDTNGIYYVISTGTSGASSFVLSRINLATPTPTLLTNLTVNLPKGSTLSSGGLGDLVYARDSVFAFINDVGLFRFPLPSTSTTSVTSSLIGSSINRTIGSLFYINSDLYNIYGYGSSTSSSTQDMLLKISTQNGTVTELTTSGIAVSQSDGAGCAVGNFSSALSFPISGTVYDDANGLMDSTVNGTGTNASGALYVQLLDSTNTVISTVAVDSDGTYSFPAQPAGTYSEILDTSSIANSTPSLPNGYVNTGENIGTGAGSDGTPNGIISSIVISNTSFTNINFGIEQLPASDNKTYSIIAPLINSLMALSGTGVSPGPLSGSDPEDGILGSNKTVIIKTVPTNSQLYYNGTLLTNNTIINNYNPSVLKVKFTSLLTLSTSFQYVFNDAANNQSTTAATYLLSWTSTLPVVLSSFDAVMENDYSVLSWKTSSEQNVKDFNVERSTDNGKTWTSIGEVMSKGNSSTTQSYSYTDDNPESGTNLYRLQVEDFNGGITYSKITQVEIQADASMELYPNPVGEEEALNIQLMGLKAGPYQITMVSSSGQTVKSMTFNISNSGSALLVVPTGNIPRGTYVVIVNGGNQHIAKTVVVANR